MILARVCGALAAFLICCTAGMVRAQAVDQAPAGVPQSAVVVLDRDALFGGSLYGRRVAGDIEAASVALVAENDRIDTELETEEQALTAQREGMDTVAFRKLADDFDTRVVAIRRAQDAKARAIQQQSDRAQALFFERVNPILVDLARETGALVILDRRSVIASSDQVDITPAARERIDAVLGEGTGLSGPEPTPRPAEEPATTPSPVPGD
ncbi:MAG: OmpH family outer membrane protein [Jannaschia sp.]